MGCFKEGFWGLACTGYGPSSPSFERFREDNAVKV